METLIYFVFYFKENEYQLSEAPCILVKRKAFHQNQLSEAPCILVKRKAFHQNQLSKAPCIPIFLSEAKKYRNQLSLARNYLSSQFVLSGH